MIIATPFENGNIFNQYGQSSAFKIYEIENNAIISMCILPCNDSNHTALSDFLKSQHTEVLICNQIEKEARPLLRSGGIRICDGISGCADVAVRAFLSGCLAACSEGCDCGYGDYGCNSQKE